MRRVKRLRLRGGGTLEALLKPIFKVKHKAFTLAEMMVVMLILSIVLAAMAPVVTTRSKVDQSSPWRYSEGNLSDAYYGLGESQTAMIGQREFINTDETAKLIINSNSTRPSQIAFKRDGLNQGVLRLENSTTLLGSLSNGTTLGSNSIAIGHDTTSSSTYTIALGSGAKATGTNSVSIGQNSEAQFLSVALGNAAKANSTSGGNSAVGVAIGSNAKSTNTAAIAIGSEAAASGSNSIAMGQQSKASGIYSTAIGMIAKAAGSDSIAIGVRSDDRGAKGNQSIAIGLMSNASADNTTSIGSSARATAEKATALSYNSFASGSNALAIGSDANAESKTSIAIGNYAHTTNTDALAIGNGVTASGESSIAIGSTAGEATTTASGEKAIAIGDGAVATGSATVAIGNYAEAKGNNNIAIGNHACKNMTGSNKICIGSFAGSNADEHQTDNVERIYIGGESKLNKGSAVLEVHNDSSKRGQFSNTAVVIHGNLVVNGLIFSSNSRNGSHFEYQSRGDDNGHTGHVIHFVDNNDTIKNYYRNGTVDERKISDYRLKYVGKEFTSGLDKIRALKVFNYTFKKDKTKEPHVGVMAQDLQKVFPDAVKKGADGFLTIRMEDMFYAVINAVKELDSRVTALEKENAELKVRLERLEAKIK